MKRNSNVIPNKLNHWEQIQARRKAVVPLSRPVFSVDELDELAKVLDSRWVTKGPKAEEFERMAEDYLGVKRAVAVSNCTSALHLALLALGIGPGDRVIVSDYSFPATGFAVKYVGATPVFCDIDPRTYNMDSAFLARLLTNHEKGTFRAIIVVHAFGQCADMTQIMHWADLYGVPVIEDAACAFGAKWCGCAAGTMGAIGCFSFHARKGITTGEGGMVVTNDPARARDMRRLSEFGVASTWGREQGVFFIPEFLEVGYNYKMSDITAAVGVAQMRKLPMLIAGRKRGADKYPEVIRKHLRFMDPAYCDPRADHIWQAYVGLVKPEFRRRRDEIIQFLIDSEIQANIGTYALHRQPAFLSYQKLEMSGDVFERAIALPLFYNMAFEKIRKGGEEVCQKLQI